MTFGQRITQLRKDKKWSQEELAGKVGTSAPIIGRYERGEITPSIDVGKKIADALGVTLDYLIEGGELLDKEVLARTKEIQQLPEQDRDSLLLTIDNFIKATKLKAIQ